ncbi:MAG: HD domain-containing protein [Deltaproteobacteria bacterium]|nr:HD domain-containing protein [Deltaproteobacteria bacterium]
MPEPLPQSHERHRRLWELVAPRSPRDDVAHDVYHLLRVHQWATRLAPEAGVDPDLAGAAALVHDLVDVPKHEKDRPYASERSAEEARALLRLVGYSDREVAAVVEAVRTCSWSRGRAATSELGTVLQDADRLDAIGAVGVARVFATAQRMASAGKAVRLYHPTDPGALLDRPLDDLRQAADHFQLKLLKLAEGMHYPSARKEAARRHTALRAYLDELVREVST